MDVLTRSLHVAIGGDYLDRDLGTEALCASEALAVVLGVPSANLPENLKELLDDVQPAGASALVPWAISALQSLTGEHSELNDLWRENEADYPQWLAHVVQLRDRLSKF